MDLSTVTLISLGVMVIFAFTFNAIMTKDQKELLQDYDKGVVGASNQFNESLSFKQESVLRIVMLSLIVSVCTGAVLVADIIAGLF